MHLVLNLYQQVKNGMDSDFMLIILHKRDILLLEGAKVKMDRKAWL